MIEGLPISVGSLSAPAILGILVLMLFTGKLWTNAAYQEKKADAERWRLAYEAERDARRISEAQTAELLELAKTTHSFIVATFSNSERIRQSGDTDVASSS